MTKIININDPFNMEKSQDMVLLGQWDGEAIWRPKSAQEKLIATLDNYNHKKHG